MTETFHLKTGSIQQAQAIQEDYEEAQRWCNFVLLKPEWLPDDTHASEWSLRPEQEGMSSSYRMLVTGADRSLSIKQFLFDFAPPAYDHPCLWRNPKTTHEGEFPVPKAYPLRDNILWIGHDHRRFYAATVGFQRVRVEATVREGAFSDQELRDMVKHLVPVDENYAQTLRNTPFSVLSYQQRYRQTASDVPLSYWSHKRNPEDIHRAKLANEENLSTLPVQPPVLAEFGYSLDSFFIIGPEDGPPSEVDFVYEQKEKNGAYLRLLVSPVDPSSPIPYPPEKYTQECHINDFEMDGQQVHLAWLTQQGPYEAAFLYNGGHALLLAQPSAWTDEIWFRRLLQHILQNG